MGVGKNRHFLGELDALEALKSLGYSQSEASRSFEKLILIQIPIPKYAKHWGCYLINKIKKYKFEKFCAGAFVEK